MDNNAMLAPGEMIAANGSRYHLRRHGQSGTTILLESGLTMMSSSWAWLAPELGQSRRVIAYDRAGLGWSEQREGLRHARQIAQELDGLLDALKVKDPLVLVGHSMGAMFGRVFRQLNPERVSAMVWLDPSHPDQLSRSRRMRSFFFLLEFAHLLAARNLPSVTVRILPHLKGLPEAEYRAIRSCLKAPGHLRTCAREARAWKFSADQARQADCGSVPVLVISAQKSALRNWAEYQRDLARVSPNSRHITFTDMSHLSMLANREHAARVLGEINGFLSGLRL